MDDIQSGFFLTLDDHFTIAHGKKLTLENADGEEAEFTLLADFRDLVRDPFINVRRTNLNVRRTNPLAISLDLLRGVAWVADASQNSVERVSRTRKSHECSPSFGGPLQTV